MGAESDTPERKLDKFDDLARKLLKVPKSEVDEAREKELEAAREKRRPQAS